ncbi:hypothetical protein GCM10017044_05500 [Kordiimonas sediminis]|uniref:Uncharacterized protein n=2 Tax=Kordiimonas sediminis TaxID=1735581 RepID=A0A919E4Y9_9PROT|nr:hypothetical protein GCM10017044_05500 [Kordiimonas sediminis]
MSTWGIENYVENRIPVFKNIVELEAPAFLLENSPLLSLDESENTYLVSLLATDQHILNENYLPFWGRLRVLGKSVTLSNEDSPVSFQIFREGHYTNKDIAPVIINEQTVMPGEALYLTKGVHTARSTLADQHLRLLWGENLSTPIQPAPDGPIFTKF